MRQPPVFEHLDFLDYVCKLKKAISGLRQASSTCYNELQQFLIIIGFQRSHSDNSLFIFRKPDIILYILVYVDDILITGNKSVLIRQVIDKLATRFSIKDLGYVNYFLGVEVLRNNDGIIYPSQNIFKIF